jgi:hypothetical protein
LSIASIALPLSVSQLMERMSARLDSLPEHLLNAGIVADHRPFGDGRQQGIDFAGKVLVDLDARGFRLLVGRNNE